MKVKVGIIAVMAVVFSMVASGSAFAVTCDAVDISGVATTGTTPSGMAVQMTASQTCGTWTAGTKIKYFLSTENTDRSLAILLTAMSLGKQVWIDVSAFSKGGIINVVSMNN